MARHTITHADEIFAGAQVGFAVNNSQRGLPVSLVHRLIILNAIALDADGLVTAAGSGATPAAGNVPIDGVFLSGGVGVLDVARNIGAVSTGAGDTTQTLTITGTDIVGNPQVEDIALNGTTAVFGAKAFKTVTSITLDIVMAGNLTVGTPAAADTELGLDGRLLNAYDVLHSLLGTGAVDAGVFTVADTATPTAVTGDARGTYNPAAAPDGSADFILYYVADLTKEGYGENFTG